MTSEVSSDATPEALIQKFYNGSVVDKRLIHSQLMVLRVLPDSGVPPYEPGQYVTLGLGSWAQRFDGGERHPRPQIIRRAYSIACPLINAAGELWPCHDTRFLEFYITLVPRDDDEHPPLTPRLFALQAGDRLHIGRKPVGHYTLAPIQSGDNVIFAATGTGEAPHNAMAAELLSRGHRGQIASLTCVRLAADAAYQAEQARLSELYPNYVYRLLTTREPRNLDATQPDYVGKQYLQDLIETGSLPRLLGWVPDPVHTHVFLCGNPSMIGLPEKNDAGQEVFPEPVGVVQRLVEQGFRLDHARVPGNIHFEKYW